jgi:hypothetical protein
MIKTTKRLDVPQYTIEVTQKEGKYSLWLHNKSLDEHVSIVLDVVDFGNFVEMLGSLTCRANI